MLQCFCLGKTSVRASGLQMVQVAAFAETEQYPLVVKPIESAGADGFKLCDSMDEAGQKPQQ